MAAFVPRIRYFRDETDVSWPSRQNVLVPIDFSDESFRAVDTALEMVPSPERLLVLHVLAELSPVEPGELWQALNDDTRRQHVADSLAQRFSTPPYAGCRIEVRFGDPGHEITECARQQQCDLIVISSHGRRGIRRLLIGSVAERVVRLAECPVLVLRD